ncbi:hypothetical protein SAMN05444417_0258 [Wenxinia saemankumensis]|uniref:Uncharacterized protein n=1 Tax=Wenxinia saemankumensis TaxID=1447782 RepID=A0A1M6A6C8_9RHOB|nr:hypothetical protein SAMN05444417_0258 [Wenxinia saemankumensis]
MPGDVAPGRAGGRSICGKIMEGATVRSAPDVRDTVALLSQLD